jgi:ketosteroid isomerase-like protein
MLADRTRLVIERLRRAFNEHDLETFVGLFDEDYESRWPIHPDRDFDGVDPVRERWRGNFERMPDFTAELLALAVDRERAWTEWRWSGTRPDGTRFDEQGVIIYTVRGRRIVAGRLYLEPRPSPAITPDP